MPPPFLPTALPSGPPSPMGSPELAQAGGVRTPESQILMASPLADRMAGAIMHQQQMQQASKIAEALRSGLKMLANLSLMSDPKTAAKFEKMSADLLSKFPPSQGAPQTAGGVNMMAGNLTGGVSGQGMPPMPVSGTNRMPGSMMGPPGMSL